jgi:hypothetical protein
MDAYRNFQQLFNHLLATTVTSSKLFGYIGKGRPLQYHILLFGVVYGCLSSLPAIGQLLLVTAAIFNNSYDISV